MATTSLWHIEGSLNDLINYVENPKKTIKSTGKSNDLSQLFDYVVRDEKTDGKQYVTAINCLKEIALKQMILTKKQFNKTSGYIAYHGYQSFKPDELTSDECHKIGVELAKEMWGDRFQVIVTTHLDREHLHNHFCINSVSFLDGKKYNYSKSEIQRLRNTSDRICLEHNLSIIEKPLGKTPRSIYFAERDGKPTKYNLLREAIDFAVENSATYGQFLNILREWGYKCEFYNRGKCYVIRSVYGGRSTRMYQLGENYRNSVIRRRIEANPRKETTQKYNAVMGYYYGQELNNYYKAFYRNSRIYRDLEGLKALYYRYGYMLGVMPESKGHQPLSPQLRQSLRFIDRYSRQVRLVSKYSFETYEQVERLIENNNRDIGTLEKERAYIYSRFNRTKDPEQKEQYRKRKEELTKALTVMRQENKVAKTILEDKDTIQRRMEVEERALKDRFEYGRARIRERNRERCR